jgi:hypothetical protein
VDYTLGIDSQITRTLDNRGQVDSSDIPGVSDEDATQLLRQYVELHDGLGLVFDGRVLRVVAPPVAQPPSPAPAAALSPVDEILRVPVTTSLLDTKPSGGHVPRWWWILPLSLGIVGGLAAWWFTREQNRAVARALLITGIVITVLTIATIGPTRALLKGFSDAMVL